MGEKRRKLNIGPSTRGPETHCLNCGKLVDAGTGVGHQRQPRPGGIALCLYCGHLQAYDDTLKMRPLTDEEMIYVAGDEVILAIQKARELMAKHGVKP
jgi:hypothetical protein